MWHFWLVWSHAKIRWLLVWANVSIGEEDVRIYWFETSCALPILDFSLWFLWRAVDWSHCQISCWTKNDMLGVSFSTFQDYVQMGESSAQDCLWKLLRGIVECSEILDYYLRSPTNTKSDACRIVELHKKLCDIHGCLGWLDVTKIHWAACPSGWKGQFEGKEGYPTID